MDIVFYFYSFVFNIKNFINLNLFFYFFEKMIVVLFFIICILLAVAFFTLVERKIMGFMQRRRGPNIVGFHGLMQPLADGLKLIFKENILPLKANSILFYLAPIITFFLSMIGWSVVPFDMDLIFSDIQMGIIYIFAVSSLSVYGVICGGWSSNSKYPLLGSLRSAAQMISYEVSFGLIIMVILNYVESLNLLEITLVQSYCWNIIPFYFGFLMFFISALAETNRPPFDLPEAEAELVSGYNVEYSSLSFALFFLGEYSSILLMGSFGSILFLGGYGFILGPLFLSIKISFFNFLFVWVRAAFPRLRYDQLMQLGWKIILPFSLVYLLCFLF